MFGLFKAEDKRLPGMLSNIFMSEEKIDWEKVRTLLRKNKHLINEVKWIHDESKAPCVQHEGGIRVHGCVCRVRKYRQKYQCSVREKPY